MAHLQNPDVERESNKKISQSLALYYAWTHGTLPDTMSDSQCPGYLVVVQK